MADNLQTLCTYQLLLSVCFIVSVGYFILLVTVECQHVISS